MTALLNSGGQREARATFGRVVGADGVGSGRTIRYVFSDPSVARDNHVIKAGAWDLANFLKNPVFLWAHDQDSPPIGKVTQIAERSEQLVGAVEYLDRDISPFADSIFQMTKAGFLNATSVSWLPIDWKYTTDRSRPSGIDFSRVELLEIRQVPVPALPSALATARARGIDTAPIHDWAARRLDDKDVSRMSKHELELIERTARADQARRKVYPSAAVGADGFSSLGEYLRAVAHEAALGAPALSDSRLVRARVPNVRAPSGLNEGSPEAGAFAVPTTFLDEVFGSIFAESVLGGLIDKRETDRPLLEVKLPGIDERTRADGGRLGAVESFWSLEGTQPPSTFPRFGSINFQAGELVTLMMATSELCADAPLLESTFREVIASELGYRLDQAVIMGDGAGVPLGVVAAPASIKIAPEVGQASGTITAANISSMWAAMPGPLRRRAIWVGNSDVETQLDLMNTGGATTGLYQPSGSAGDTTPRIKGRPLYLSEANPILGAPGDLVLMDPKSYLLLSNPVRFAMTVHAKFLTDEVVFRVVWRLDGRPKYMSAVSPANGGAPQSPYVILGPR